MSRARELAMVVAQARQDILNRDTVRQCRSIYQAIMEQAERGAKLGAYHICGHVVLDPNEKYDVSTTINQMLLKLQLEEFEEVQVFGPNVDGEDKYIDFDFNIPEYNALEAAPLKVTYNEG